MASKPPAKTRTRVLGVLTVGAIVTIAVANFEWVTLTMKPKGDTVVLGALTGAEQDSRISALALFLLAWVAVLWLVRGFAIRAIAAVGLAAVAGLGYVVTEFLLAPLAHDASGRIATLTNVAEAHDVTELDVVTSGWPYVSLLACVALFAGAVVVVASAGAWPTRHNASSAKKSQIGGAAEPVADSDPISLWDSQRDK